MNNLKKTIILCFVLFSCFIGAKADVEINETTFPDEEFRSWVLRQSYGQDGVLTEEEIANVTRITVVGGRDIQSLKGIESFTALTYLNCASNHLTALDVSKCTKLEVLYCDCNQLNLLDVSKNTALKELACAANPLTTLDISMNPELTNLACSQCQLTSLDVSQNNALTQLSCNSNQLTSLDVSKNTALTILSCKSNQLTSLDVSKNTALKRLICNDNQLTSLNVAGCPVLEDIRCYSNQIKGEAMDALMAGLPTVEGFLGVINYKDEQNVMTKSQASAAKAKGWYVRYIDSNNQWKNYEGSDEATGIGATLNDRGKMTNDSLYDLSGRKLSGKPARGIYIEGGKKKVK